jgi:HrpA-like RNA helicase
MGDLAIWLAEGGRAVTGVDFLEPPLEARVARWRTLHAALQPEPDAGAQAAADAAGEPVSRVIVATNAVESSVTLAAVDVVICLGQCKRIAYDVSTHRQVLERA